MSGYLYLRSSKAPAPTPGCGCGGRHGSSGDGAAASSAEEAAADGQATFDRIADLYDSCINTDETFMGIKLMRRWLMRHAQVSTEHLQGLACRQVGHDMLEEPAASRDRPALEAKPSSPIL